MTEGGEETAAMGVTRPVEAGGTRDVVTGTAVGVSSGATMSSGRAPAAVMMSGDVGGGMTVVRVSVVTMTAVVARGVATSGVVAHGVTTTAAVGTLVTTGRAGHRVRVTGASGVGDATHGTDATATAVPR